MQGGIVIRHLDDYSDVLTPEDLMEVLRVGRNTVYRLLKKGEISSLRVGSKYRIPKKCVYDYLSKVYNDRTNDTVADAPRRD